MLSDLWSDLRYRWRALFERRELERDLEDELRFHLEREAEKYRGQGLSPDEAMRRARLAFGGVDRAKESSRDGRGTRLFDGFVQDVRYAWRSLGRTPAFTIGVILTLGLGIGANAAMFGIVDRLLFRTPPYLAQPDQVHRLYLSRMDRGTRRSESTTEYTRYLDLRRNTTAFSDLAAYSTRPLAVGFGTDAREMNVETVSAQLFDFFDAPPVLGRYFTPAEDSVPVGAMVAVLGYGYWQTQYGGRTDVLGQPIKVGIAEYRIIGVTPRDFIGISEEGPPAVFVPITAYAGTFRGGSAQTNYYTRYNWSWLRIVARRKPGVTLAQADADLTRAYQLSWANEESIGSRITPASIAMPQGLAGPIQAERGPNQHQVTRVASWVSAVTAIVLLIACANVANLLLARAIRRRREIAVRLALGVSRGRLAVQLLTECLMLAGCGAVVGLAVAQWGGAVLRKLFISDPVAQGSVFDVRTLIFALVIAALAGTMTGLVPILQSRRTNLIDALKSGVREGVYRRSRTRSALLLFQAALSVVLLVGAALFVQSLRNVQSLRLGYDVDPILYVSPNMRGVKLSDVEQANLRRRLGEVARQIPGVESAALGLTVPFWDSWGEDLFVQGIDSVQRLGDFTLQGADADHLRTVGTRLDRGRDIAATDQAGAPPVVLVSESMAKKLWPGQDALGQCLRMSVDTTPCITVVGITEDMKQNSITDDAGLHYYLPIEQFHPEAAVLFVRVKGHAADLQETVRRQLQPLMPGDGYITVTPMRDIVDPNLSSWQLGASMFAAFGGLALVLAAIGLYSVLAYDVAQRTQEIGIRLALGARLTDLFGLIIREGMKVALAGVVIGAGIALVAGRWIQPLLFGQSPRDPMIYLVVSSILLVVAGFACAMPAFRATRVDPNVALRAE